MKAVCIIASDNVVIDGDVIFCKLQGVYLYHVGGVKNVLIKNSLIYSSYYKNMPLKIKALWFWHMVVLKKSHVYLTGVRK